MRSSSNSGSSQIFTDESVAIIPLPPRNDTESEVVGEFEFPAGVLNFEGQDYEFPQSFSAKVLAKWFDENLLSVKISLDAKVIAECARCLKPVEFEISDNLDYLYFASAKNQDPSLDSETLSEFDDAGFFPVEVEFFGRTLDVMPQIQESIYTLLPFRILCRDDCKGLCPECGADLNEGNCDCKRENADFAGDSRFAVLKDLRLE